MAAITSTTMLGAGARAVTVTTLGSSDTLAYNPAKKGILILDNVTGGGLTPNIDGDGGGNVSVPGIGTVDVSGGLTLASIGAGNKVVIPLDSIKEYLAGTVTITGGTGIEATFLEY